MAKSKASAPGNTPPARPVPAPLPAEELTRYLTGGAPPAGSHLVEERLLNSALHAAAAEGLAAANKDETAAALATLTERLQTRINQPAAVLPAPVAGQPTAAKPAANPATSAPQLRTAASGRRRLWYWVSGSLVVLLALGLWLQQSYQKFTDEEALAAQKRRAANYRGEDAEPKSFLSSLFGSDEPSEEDIARLRADSLATVARVAEVARVQQQQQQDQRRREQEEQNREAEAIAAVAAAPVAAPAPVARVERPAEATTRRMRGQVTTDAGNPIGGAQVTLRATGKKVAAGADGWYTIEIPPGVDGALDVEAPGFVSRATKANAEGQANVQLSTTEAVAVRSMASAAAAEKRTKSVRPEPEGGYGAYYRYIASAAKLPTDARKADVRGNVQVEFQVNTDGSLSNFRVVTGLGYGCDEEAVRAIQDGPKWTPGKVNDEAAIRKVSIPVSFGR